MHLASSAALRAALVGDLSMGLGGPEPHAGWAHRTHSQGACSECGSGALEGVAELAEVSDAAPPGGVPQPARGALEDGCRDTFRLLSFLSVQNSQGALNSTKLWRSTVELIKFDVYRLTTAAVFRRDSLALILICSTSRHTRTPGQASCRVLSGGPPSTVMSVTPGHCRAHARPRQWSPGPGAAGPGDVTGAAPGVAAATSCPPAWRAA